MPSVQAIRGKKNFCIYTEEKVRVFRYVEWTSLEKYHLNIRLKCAILGGFAVMSLSRADCKSSKKGIKEKKAWNYQGRGPPADSRNTW